MLHLLCLFYQFLFFQAFYFFQTLENSFLLLTDDRCSLLEHISLSCSEELDTVGCVCETGMFTPSDALAEELSAASKKAGEKLWRMPMEEAYWEMMKSNIADMVNTGARAGGSITAALFLKQVNINL